MSQIRLEFIVEPFREGVLGPHVAAALDTLRAAGFEPEVGPLANLVEGQVAPLLDAVSRAGAAAFAAGATGLSLSARATDARDGELDDFLAAVRPVARVFGALLLEPEDLTDDDVPLRWKGRVVAGLHPPAPNDLRDGLAHLVGQIEAELGGFLAGLSRVDKQRAVRLLDERGAFALRNAVDEVADAMGVSRVTVYNYLNATRASALPPG